MSEQIFTSCTNGSPILVHVKDGRITRIRPIVFDEKDAASWIIDVNGRKISPPRKATSPPPNFTERMRVYSDTRIRYPLKRRDFDPSGDRHPENRGKSGYERISWDEALDIVSGEMKRIRATYGPAAVTAITSSHHISGNINFRHSAFRRFFNLLGFIDM